MHSGPSTAARQGSSRGYTAVEDRHLPSFTTIRVTALLLVLIVAVLISTHQSVYSRSWNKPLEVRIFPINGDGSAATANYINTLNDDSFHSINQWGVREAKRHNIALSTPLNVRLGDTIASKPPALADSASALGTIFWGLNFRWWAYRNTPDDGGDFTRVRLFVLYYQGTEDEALAHSLGMEKGLMGLVHAFASDRQTQQNNVVIAHEILHTVGAVDKYDSADTPFFPAGFAEPKRNPVYPQINAEVMAGRIPLSPTVTAMPDSLRNVVVSRHTAQEINWLEE